MKIIRILSCFLAIAWMNSFFHMPVSARICNRVVAIVNNEVITLYELDAKTEELTGVETADLKTQDENLYLDTRRKVLDLLIEEKIAGEKIRELGIAVTREDVDAAIERIKEGGRITHEDLMAGLKEKGMDYDEYRASIKTELERIRLINFEVKSKIIVIEEKISEYYNQHKNEFKVAEEVRLAAIFLSQPDAPGPNEPSSLHQTAEDILLRLRRGEDFSELAAKYSHGPGSKMGGDLGFFKTSQIEPELLSIIRDLSVGDVSEPIMRPTGIQIIKLVEKQEASLKSLDEMKDTIREILYRNEVNKRYNSWIKELREKAYVKTVF